MRCFIVMFAAVVALVAPARDAGASVAGDILSLTGNARTKFVWMRQTPDTIMLFDTNVGSEQVVTQGPFGWPQVFITPTGTRIIFMKNTTSLYVVDTSGANERELCAAKSALGVAEDPPGTEWAYYGDAAHNANPQGRLWRVQIDNTTVKELVWDKTSICWQWAFTRDGKTAAAALPWPGCHIANLPNGSYYQVHDSGCQVGIAPSATRMLHCTALQFGGEHRGISVHVIPGGSDTEINLGNAPGVNNQMLLWPNWAMYDDRFFVVSGPWSGTPGIANILFAKVNAAFNGIDNWVQVTQAPAGMQDCAPICWIQSGSVPANVTIDTFTASPSNILPGGSSTLSWSTTNATSVSIDQGIGAVAADGSTSVSPAATTTYTLTAQGTGGPAARQVSVNVSFPVLTTIVVYPSNVTILANESAGFNAETLDQFGDPISGTVDWSVSGGGSLSPTTGSSTTFTPSVPEGTFTVTASWGSVQGFATVTVEREPSITILSPADDEVWHVGTTRYVRWTTTNLDNAVIDYSVNGGLAWLVVEDAAIFQGQADWGDYPWVIPDNQSPDCLIQVRDYLGGVLTQSGTFTIKAVSDADGDGMDDAWEVSTFGDMSHDQTTDYDGDGHSDLDEFQNGTDPSDPNDPGGSGWGSTGLSCAPARTSGAAGLAAALALAALVVCTVGRAHWRTAIDGRI